MSEGFFFSMWLLNAVGWCSWKRRSNRFLVYLFIFFYSLDGVLLFYLVCLHDLPLSIVPSFFTRWDLKWLLVILHFGCIRQHQFVWWEGWDKRITITADDAHEKLFAIETFWRCSHEWCGPFMNDLASFVQIANFLVSWSI